MGSIRSYEPLFWTLQCGVTHFIKHPFPLNGSGSHVPWSRWTVCGSAGGQDDGGQFPGSSRGWPIPAVAPVMEFRRPKSKVGIRPKVANKLPIFWQKKHHLLKTLCPFPTLLLNKVEPDLVIFTPYEAPGLAPKRNDEFLSFTKSRHLCDKEVQER